MSDYGCGYATYGYGNHDAAGVGGAYAVTAGGYIAPYIIPAGPGTSAYYSYYSGATKYVDYAYENHYGGVSTYHATFNPNGDFVQTTYNYSSSDRTESDETTYTSQAHPDVSAYNGYDYHQISTSYSSLDASTHIDGSSRFLETVSFSSNAYFDGSFSTASFDMTSTVYDGMTVPGSIHTYSATSYTDPAGYTTYHSSGT